MKKYLITDNEISLLRKMKTVVKNFFQNENIFNLSPTSLDFAYHEQWLLPHTSEYRKLDSQNYEIYFIHYQYLYFNANTIIISFQIDSSK